MSQGRPPFRITPPAPGDAIWNSGWGRWLPGLAVYLYASIARGADLGGLSLDEPALDSDDDDQLVPDDERIRRLREATGFRIETLADCLDLLEKLRLIRATQDGWVASEDVALLPEDVLALTEDERRQEDELRWDSVVAPAREVVIKICALAFLRSGDAAYRWSLDHLNEILGYDQLVLRDALLGLVDDGDFRSSADIATVSNSELFEFSVDWDRFHELRLSPAELLGLPRRDQPESFNPNDPDGD